MHRQEESFRAFANRPEHKKFIEAHQRKEARQALRLKEQKVAAEFQAKVRREWKDGTLSALLVCWILSVPHLGTGFGNPI